MAEIDPVKYGVLWERVQNYERRFDEMSVKMDKMEANVEKLVALANQGRGGPQRNSLQVAAVGEVMVRLRWS